MTITITGHGIALTKSKRRVPVLITFLMLFLKRHTENEAEYLFILFI